MPVGICKLCLQTHDLRGSHLLPKALYRISRFEGSPNPNPWLVTARGRVQTSRQIKDFVFCHDCEQRLSRNGERYAMNQVNRDSGFALLSALQGGSPGKSSGGFTFYDRTTTPTIDREKLGYFALSVFWRAAVHLWHRPEQKDPMVCLGKYQEPIRKYLVGETSFPSEVVVLLFVCTDLFSQSVFYEPSKGSQSDESTWTFQTRGLNFFLMGKEGKPDRLGEACLVQGPRQMIVARSCEEKVLGATMGLLLDPARRRENKGK